MALHKLCMFKGTVLQLLSMTQCLRFLSRISYSRTTEEKQPNFFFQASIAGLVFHSHLILLQIETGFALGWIYFFNLVHTKNATRLQYTESEQTL